MDVKSYIQLRGGNCEMDTRNGLRIAIVRLPLPVDKSIKVEATSCHCVTAPEDSVILEALTKAQKALDDLLSAFVSNEL